MSKQLEHGTVVAIPAILRTGQHVVDLKVRCSAKLAVANSIESSHTVHLEGILVQRQNDTLRHRAADVGLAACQIITRLLLKKE